MKSSRAVTAYNEPSAVDVSMWLQFNFFCMKSTVHGKRATSAFYWSVTSQAFASHSATWMMRSTEGWMSLIVWICSHLMKFKEISDFNHLDAVHKDWRSRTVWQERVNTRNKSEDLMFLLRISSTICMTQINSCFEEKGRRCLFHHSQCSPCVRSGFPASGTCTKTDSSAWFVMLRVHKLSGSDQGATELHTKWKPLFSLMD